MPEVTRELLTQVLDRRVLLVEVIEEKDGLSLARVARPGDTADQILAAIEFLRPPAT